jgi:hypothetical protein
LVSTFVLPNQLIEDHPSVNKLLVQDVFTLFAFEAQTLRLPEASSEFTRFPILSRFAARLVRSHQIFFNQCQPSIHMLLPSAQINLFDINLQPFCNQLITHYQPTPL